MPWVYLFIAGLLEIAWAIGLKYTDGFRKPMWSVITVILMIGSFYVLSLAIRSLPIGTAYAIWTGIGALGTAILGMILFAEPATLPRMGFLALIIAGIVGLKFTSGH
jgi:quaternary ammonium compound-resistance protein SugE